MVEQPELWEQNDLLGLLASAPQPIRPAAAPPEPAHPLAAAPRQPTASAPLEGQPAPASATAELAAVAGGPGEIPPSLSTAPPGPGPETGLPPSAPLEAETLARTFQSSPEPEVHTIPEPPAAGLQMPPPPAEPQLSSLPTSPPLALPSLAPISRRSGPKAPERVLILDTETTGLSPLEGTCIEVGAVLFHVPSRSVLQQLSFLLPCQVNGAEAINAIPAAVTRLPQPTDAALALFAALALAADAVVAHHAAFDRQWFGHGALPVLELPWICTMEDIRWPAELLLRPNPSLRDLALAHGVPVWAAHRALTDCQYLVHVFERCAQLETLLVAALEPRELYRASLSYADRHLAREAGFRWNEPVAGAWSRRLSRREADALPFPVLVVEREPLPLAGRESA